MRQLTGTKTDLLEDQIFMVVKAAGDQIDLDHLLIELYRRFGDVHQRRFMINKAYRLAQKGVIHVVPGRKGVYSVHPQERPEAEGSACIEDMAAPARGGAKETFTADLDDEIPL
jgi:hypothetical protein